MEKRYIGDGVYVEFDGYGLVLTTEDGIGVTNRIVLEQEVYQSMVQYVADVIDAQRESAEHANV